MIAKAFPRVLWGRAFLLCFSAFEPTVGSRGHQSRKTSGRKPKNHQGLAQGVSSGETPMKPVIASKSAKHHPILLFPPTSGSQISYH